MKHYLTKEQLNEFQAYQENKMNGRILTPDSLRFVCEGLQNDPEAIGRHFLEVLSKFRSEGIVK